MATLPLKNSITLDADNAHWVVDDSELIAVDDDALLRLLPRYARRGDSAVRAAVITSFRKLLTYCWAQWGQLLAAYKSPRFADGVWLDQWGEIFKRPRAIGELDPQYRARLLTPIDMVTPMAIKRVVGALVREVSTFDPVFIDPIYDQIYLSPDDGTGAWVDFVQPDAQRYWRYNTGLGDPNIHGLPTGIRVGAGAYVLDESLTEFGVVIAEDPVTNGSKLSDRIISEVEARRGAGTIWFLLVDPAIKHAI